MKNPLEEFCFPSLSMFNHSPEHANALGKLVAEWALAEKQLESCLAFLLYLDSDVATIIYQHFISTKSKIELMMRLNRLLTVNETNQETIHAFLVQAIDLNAMRNAYIHAQWAGNMETHPCELQRISLALPHANAKKAEYERIWLTPAMILDDVAKIAKWMQEFFHALFRIDPMRLNKPPQSQQPRK